MTRSSLVLLAIFLMSLPAAAQRSGSTPRTGSSRGGSRSGTTQGPRVSPDEPVATFEGTVSGVTHKKILVDDADGNTMDFYTTKKTRIFDGDKEIKASQLKTGDRIHVEAQRHMDGTVDAVNVRTVNVRTVKPPAEKH